MKRTAMKQLVIFDNKSDITQKYRVFGVPTVIIAQKGGNIVFRQYYVPTAQEIKTLLQ